jgi:hypothetical protein
VERRAGVKARELHAGTPDAGMEARSAQRLTAGRCEEKRITSLAADTLSAAGECLVDVLGDDIRNRAG